jgi:hypothetical protein
MHFSKQSCQPGLCASVGGKTVGMPIHTGGKMKALFVAAFSLMALSMTASVPSALADTVPADPHAQFNTRFEVDCSFQNCAEDGWDLWDWSHTYSSNTTCKPGGCFITGYTVEDSNGGRMDVTCKEGGCWVGGWTSVIYPSMPGPVSYEDTTCYNRTCLTDGWWTTSAFGGVRQTACYNHDCGHFGWTSSGPGRYSNTMCKLSDCFEYGWTTDAY